MQNTIVLEIFKIKVENLRKVKIHKVKLLKFKTFKFGHEYFWNYFILHFEKIIKFSANLQLPSAGQIMMWHHHGNNTLTVPSAILLGTYVA